MKSEETKGYWLEELFELSTLELSGYAAQFIDNILSKKNEYILSEKQQAYLCKLIDTNLT